MIPYEWSVADLLSATAGTLVGGSDRSIFQRISIDSRKIGATDLFVAVKGDRFDGHDFAAAAVEQGAGGVVLEQRRRNGLPLFEWSRRGISCIVVADTRTALGEMARFNRFRGTLRVAGITGSNGKTTSRAMASAVLAQRFRVLSTSGNFNNDIGLPLTLFRLAPEHQWAVLEMGMNHSGEIRHLALICRPDVGVITNIGPAHLEGVASLEGVLRAKAELIHGLNEEGTAVLNGDDPLLRRLVSESSFPVCLFGETADADIRAAGVIQEEDQIRFDLITPQGEARVRLATPGRFMVSNALAAAAVGWLAGMTAPEIGAGLSTFRPVGGRLHLVKTVRGITLIDDTYNANPASMRGAMDTLAAVAPPGRRILVAGDMFELGEAAEQLHEEIGRHAARLGIDRLYLSGDLAPVTARGALAGGLRGDAVRVGSLPEITADLKQRLAAGDMVLIKGSRGMAMERVLQDLLLWAETADISI